MNLNVEKAYKDSASIDLPPHDHAHPTLREHRP